MPAETARSAAVAASWPGLDWLWLVDLAVSAGIHSGQSQTRWTGRQRQ